MLDVLLSIVLPVFLTTLLMPPVASSSDEQTVGDTANHTADQSDIQPVPMQEVQIISKQEIGRAHV